MNIDVDEPTSEDNTHGVGGAKTALQTPQFEEKPGLRLPSSTIPDTRWFYGAKVLEPHPGRHENVVYPDHSAMYPNMIRNLNISPETLVGTQSDLDTYEFERYYIGDTEYVNGLWEVDEFLAMDWTADSVEDTELTEDECVWGYIDTRDVKRCENHERWQQYKDSERYKAVFQRSSKGDWKKRWTADPNFERCYYLQPSIKKGFMNDVVDDMLELKAQYKGTDMYLSTKQIVNSTWGYLGYATEYNASRLFNWMMAETITLTGRKLIQHTADSISTYIEREKDTDCIVVAGDTDSAVLSMPSVGLKSTAIEYAQEAADWYNTEAADEFMREQCNVTDHYVDLEIESYAPVAFFLPAKKRYFQRITWESGASNSEGQHSSDSGGVTMDGENTDEVETKGIELVRSDVSDLTEDIQGYVRDQILHEDPGTAKANCYERLREVVERVENGNISLDRAGKRKGISKPLEEYGDENRSPTSVIRGAKYARENIPGEENISIGSKPLGFPIDSLLDDELPRTYDADTGEDGNVVDYIAVEDPQSLKGLVEVDWTEVMRKQIKSPVEDILENMGWSWSEMRHQHSQTGISEFM